MTDENVVSEAGSSEVEVDEAGISSEELVQISKAELDKFK
jgi:hypothetical protein